MLLSVAVFCAALGFWWPRRLQMTWRRCGALYLLLALAYFCHFQSYALLLVAMTVAAGFDALRRAARGAPAGRRLAAFGLTLAPAYLVLGVYSWATAGGYEWKHKSAQWLFHFFSNVKSLVYCRPEHAVIGQAIGVALMLPASRV